MAHPGDRGRQLVRYQRVARRQQADDVVDVGEHLAVVRGRPFEVTAVGQHLPADLGAQLLDPPVAVRGVAAGHRQPDQGFEVLDQMVAADIGFQVQPQEDFVPAEVGAHGRPDSAVPRERLEQPAQRPRAQGCDIRRPRGAAVRHRGSAAMGYSGPAAVKHPDPAVVDHRGGSPGRVEPGEGGPGLVAVTVGCQRPGPVQVVQVIAPQQRCARLFPVELGRITTLGV